jgi:hypothetical protein
MNEYAEFFMEQAYSVSLHVMYDQEAPDSNPGCRPVNLTVIFFVPST